jgi:hypothetical protein
MPTENRSTEEDRFGRQDPQSYSGWSSAFTIAVILIVLCIVDGHAEYPGYSVRITMK